MQGQLLHPPTPPQKKKHQPGLCFPHGLSPYTGRSGCCFQLLYFKASGAKPRVSTACAIPTLPSLVHPLWPLGTRSVPGPPLYPQQPRALPVAALCQQRERQGLGDIPSCSTTDVREYRPGKKNTRFYFIHNSSLQKRERRQSRVPRRHGEKTSLHPPAAGPGVPCWGKRPAGAAPQAGRWRTAPPTPLRGQRPWRGGRRRAPGSSGRSGLVRVVHVVHVALLVLRHLRRGRAPSAPRHGRPSRRGATAPSCASRPLRPAPAPSAPLPSPASTPSPASAPRPAAGPARPLPSLLTSQ